MAEANPYEEQRRRQVGENKRKLEELRLHNLSAAVRAAGAKPKPTLKPRNLRPPPPDAPIRRSGRVANLPEQPDYRIRRVYRNVKAESPNPVYATNEERAYAITKAEELKDQLGSDHPTFIKPMSYNSASKSAKLLIERRKFKVYIIRASSYNQNDH